ncbi:unnamed protein product [Discosporangium mesarthrocarpum]
MKIAYIDCFSGVAGDMLLAGLLDAGAPLNKLIQGLKTIPSIADEWDINLRRVTKGMVSVTFRHDHDHDHDQDQDQNHGSHNHGHNHSHSHNHSHNHDKDDKEDTDNTQTRGDGHGHHHGHSHDHGPLRNLETITKMLETSGLPQSVKDKSAAVFKALGEAEAKTHGATLSQVHFHEVGAIDSIIDTVGVVYALHLLGIEEVHCSALPYSEGTVWTAHGILPVPAPATLHLMVGIPTCPGPKSASGELVTPTGAALVKVLSKSFGRPPPFSPMSIGEV